jgi:hypothetical protein
MIRSGAASTPFRVYGSISADTDGHHQNYAFSSLYFLPQGRFAGTKNPMIDAAYGGPQVILAPRNFVEAYRGGERGKIALAGLSVRATTSRPSSALRRHIP